MAPLRAAQVFSIPLHHRLQDLHPGLDAQAMERFPDTVQHAEHRQRHLIETVRELRGWLERFRLSCFAMGGSPPVVCTPVLPQNRGEESPPASPQFNSIRDIPHPRVCGEAWRCAERL